MNFEFITSNFPRERDAARKLKELLRQNAERGAEYTLNRLIDLVQPKSREDLAAILGVLVRQGELKQVLRVFSRKIPGSIGEFDSLKEIPRVIHDWRTDTHMEVEPSDIKIYYVLPAHDAA